MCKNYVIVLIMKSLVKKTVEYIESNLGVIKAFEPLKELKGLPMYIADNYLLYRVRILNRDIILAVYDGNNEHPPGKIEKHMNKLLDVTGILPVYVCNSVVSYNRKRLIEKKIAFIVPEKQMFVPFVGLDLCERLKKEKTVKKTLDPSSQLLLLYLVTKRTSEKLSLTEFAKLTGYSRMTISRGIDDLSEFDFVDAGRKGKFRFFKLAYTPEEVWDKCREFLRSPVTDSFWVKETPKDLNTVIAGLDALAVYSSLAEPNYRTLAVDAYSGRSYRLNNEHEVIPGKEEDSVKIELWTYSPFILAENKAVDRLSLALSLSNENDERIESAIDEMMKGMKW